METSDNSPEQNLNPSISSAVGTPVSRSAVPESAGENPTLGIFGQSSLDCFAFLDPNTRSWKTSQGAFLWGSGTYSETWPNSGTMRNGRVYALQTSGPATCGSGCSLWPTATEGSGSGNRDPKESRHFGHGPTLNDAVMTWPTATAHEAGTLNQSESGGPPQNLAVSARNWPTARQEDGESCGNHPGAMDSLTGAAKLWPTAQSHDCRGEKTPEQIERQRNETGAGVRNLNEEAATWPTPTVDDASNVARASGQMNSLSRETHLWATPNTPSGGPNTKSTATHTGGLNLDGQAQLWQTPATDSFRSRGGDRKDEQGLDQQARFFPTPQAQDAKNVKATSGRHATDLSGVVASLPVPQTPDGPQSSESAPTSRRRLNPRFVEFLMNFPIGWTEL